MSDSETLQTLRVVEEALVEHRAWGDSSYIRAQLEASFTRRLEAIAPHLPVAGQLAAALPDVDVATRNRIVGNTVIRCAVQHAHLRVSSDAEYGLSVGECEAVLEATVQHLALGRHGTPFESAPLAQLWPGSEFGWIWNDEYPNDVFGSAFRKIMELEYGDGLATIGEGELAGLRRGGELLLELLPALGRDALGHTYLIGCFSNQGFWRGKLSSSQIRAGGTIFLSREMLTDPWCVAEHLLHESLHQKLYDFRHGHQLLRPDIGEAGAPTIEALWNSPEPSGANRWDTPRTFAAFHVYAQLSLLALVAEELAGDLAAEYGPPRGLIDSRRALDRAQYLGEQLDRLRSTELGPAGCRLLDWLRMVLEVIDPAPPPKGATTHLLRDLYLREANRVDVVLAANGHAPCGLSERLVPVAKQEIAGAAQVLAAMGDSSGADRLADAIRATADEELGTYFPLVRRSIAAVLTDVAPSRFALGASDPSGQDADALFRQLVERGSEQLYLIEADIPAAVAAARRRAKSVGFKQSCENEVGRLLSTLAAAVRPNGSILEIGTGVGVGTAWLVAGLEGRHDVTLLTIESEERLAEVTSEWRWPAFVRLQCADATQATLPTECDLIFVDAAPVKYGHIAQAVAALRPGGILVVDDLQAGPRTTDSERAEKDALRQCLLGSADLRAVELDWSSGVIMATKSRGEAGGQEPEPDAYPGAG